MTKTETTGIKCGHCKGRHPTVAEVRACAGVTQINSRRRNDPLPEVDSKLTPKQAGFLDDLLGQFSLELDKGLTPETISYKDGQPIISRLVDARRKQATGRSFSLPPGTLHLSHPNKGQPRERTPTQPKWPDVPPGHYAVPGKLLDFDRNDLYFYRVDRPETGNWSGRTSVKMIVGGKPEYYIKRTEIRAVLNAIVKFGIEDAAILFSQETKNCNKCNYHLTRKASRVMSIGPDCAEKYGRGAEWRELDAAYGHALAEDDE